MNSFKKGLRDGVPIGLGYLSVSFSFGILGIKYGLSIWETVLISMTNLTSAGQFAGLEIIAACGTYMEMLLAQLVINLRYSLMSISLSQKVDENFTTAKRLVLGHGITDEIFGGAISNEGEIGYKYFTGLIIAPYLGWSLGTLLGAICGDILPDNVCSALGIALYGMFVAIVVPPMKKSRSIQLVVIIAVLLSSVFKWVRCFENISSGTSIIICAVVASAIGAALFPVKEAEYEQ